MVLTPSTMLSLGTLAPGFALPEVASHQIIRLEDFREKKALLVIFLCRHCPYVQHIQAELPRLGHDYQSKGLAIVGISSNDANQYPDDAPQALAAFAHELKLSYPILYDESQEVAKAYRAACTPDFFLFDAKRYLVYRGQLDDSRPGNSRPVTGESLRVAIEAVLSDQPLSDEQKPSVGCNIKWKKGNTPSYF